MLIMAVAAAHPVSNMLNKLHGQPESYDKKYDSNIPERERADQSADQDTDLVELLVLVHTVSLEKQKVLLGR